MNQIAEFLRSQFELGISYHQLGCYRAALSAILPKVEGGTIAHHEVIVRVMQAAYRHNPPKVRYNSTWNVEPVIQAWNKANEPLSLCDLTVKTFTLVSFATMGRTADLRSLGSTGYSIARTTTGDLEHLALNRLRLPKQQKSGPLLPVIIKALGPDMADMCPVRACLAYMSRTANLRDNDTLELFISTRKPHKAIAPKTASRWLLRSMGMGDIDLTTFKAHSTCGAAASSKVKAGATISEIMSAGRWYSQSTLRKSYLRELPN